jgi:hypothetical protein
MSVVFSLHFEHRRLILMMIMNFFSSKGGNWIRRNAFFIVLRFDVLYKFAADDNAHDDIVGTLDC